MVKLGVNIDHIATVRQQRTAAYPSVLAAARAVREAGAHSITVHLREDRRHIQEHDVRDIRKKIPIKLNLEMAPTSSMIDFACTVKPHRVCLVPEKRKELTTEGGLDVQGSSRSLKKKILLLRRSGIEVSIFVDPTPAQIQSAAELNADFVELHTGRYAEQTSLREIKKLRDAAILAHGQGLQVNAGHGLDYRNVTTVAKLPYINELNIGFSIVARALFVGLEKAVKEMLLLVT